jgi:hypothetical protein
MKAACSASTSAANAAGNFSLSRDRKPSCGAKGAAGAPGGGSAVSVLIDSPASGAKAAM